MIFKSGKKIRWMMSIRKHVLSSLVLAVNVFQTCTSDPLDLATKTSHFELEVASFLFFFCIA